MMMKKKQDGEQTRGGVVLVPFPSQGRINPMLQLGTILYSQGFSITVVHPQFNCPDPSTHPHFTFESIDDGIPEEDISSWNIWNIIWGLNDNCEKPLKEWLDRRSSKMPDHGHQWRITCVIYDDLMYFASAAASHLKLPSIVLRTNSFATFLARAAIPLIKPQKYMTGDPVPNLQSLRFKDLPVAKVGLTEDFLRLIPLMIDTRTTSAVIWNTIECLEKPFLTELQKQCQVPSFPIGPMHKFAPDSTSNLANADTGCITWLDKQTDNSVLYVSYGSQVCIDEEEATEMAFALANSEQPFLWVLRPGLVIGSKWNEFLPEGFTQSVGERGYIAKWAPQKQVLAHPAVGGFWSHCGWNSTLESASEGVPMICRPISGDQRVNARCASHVWAIGLQLDNELLNRKEMESAVRKLMVDEQGKEMRQMAKLFKEKIQVSITQGGSSYNSLNDLVNFISS
ncbi:hypothetical protein Tsubulata_001830 [Turnera subulata]|uniref:Glycosyltransferase n=1 Tax=Turnera subulata TaxID=218843 RepID=A0A9Q0JJ34_9ROSI|nr:hypothetical protein Tsubulata_001830 [Turnera subulata]